MELSKIYTEYHPYLMSISMKVMRNREDAEDIIQDLFLKLPKKLEYYKKHENVEFRTWLGMVTKNFCIDQIRREKNKFNKGGYDIDDLIFIKSKFDVFSDVAFSDLLKNYKDIINVLHIRDRELLYYVIDDYSYKQIQDEIGETEIYVKSMLHQARKNFIDIYAH